MTSKMMLFGLSFFIAHWSFATGTITCKVEVYDKDGEAIKQSINLSVKQTVQKAKEEALKQLSVNEEDYDIYDVKLANGQIINPDDQLEKYTSYSFLFIK